MRSSWVYLFFHRTAVGGLIAHPPQGRQTVLPSPDKAGNQRSVQVSGHRRICLGIGDGAVRRQ
jgi:hypothetical protein